MTKEEAIFEIEHVNVMIVSKEARDIAIKSLQAWDKVINEIKEMIEFNSDGDYISEAGCGMEDCLGVIKKYIEEVEK